MITLTGKYASANIMIDNVEQECISQIYEFLNHPLYSGSKIVIQADTHGGKGSVIGFTSTLTNNGICPNVVGVDIACGMNCWEIETPDDFVSLDKLVRSVVPLGMTVHTNNVATMGRDFPWKQTNKDTLQFVRKFNKNFDTQYFAPTIDYDWFVSLNDDMSKASNTEKLLGSKLARTDQSIGTLGGGNHFIEIDVDETGHHYLVIHSGSRNIGQRIATYYQHIAESQKHNAAYNKDLAYLREQDMIDYLVSTVVMRHFASLNRKTMGEEISKATGLKIGNMTETIHNFIDDKDFIVRKGSIRAYSGENMLIPFNMRDGSWLCEGKSNPNFNFSAPHGAGRVMSRSQAKRSLNMKDFEETMKGIFTTSVCPETLDEAPDAYKPAKIIQEAIGDTAKIIHKLKPVYNLKSSEESFIERRKREKMEKKE